MDGNNLPVATHQTDLAVANTANRCREIEVRDQGGLTAANELLKGIKALRLEINREFDPGIQEAFAHHRTLVAQKHKWTDPLDQAERNLKPKIANYLTEQERLALEAGRRQAEAEAKLRQVADQASDDAYEKIRNGDLDEADNVVAQAGAKIEQIQAARPAQVERPIAVGTSLRQLWKWELQDPQAVPREYLKLDEQKLNGIARTMRDQANVPGIRFYAEATVATRLDK